MKRPHLGQAATSLAAFFLLAGAARAGSFAVNPVRVSLTATQPVAALTVHNEASEPVVIQLETSAWSQRDGTNVLTDTREILATPPIFTLAPGATQIVRVGLRRAPDARRELTYRLELREVPPPEPLASGLRVALAVSMPVFVAASAGAAPSVQWTARRAPDGRIELAARNVGTAHVKIASIELSTAGGARIDARQVADYVLPDTSRSWMLNDAAHPAPGSELHLLARTDVGDVITRLPLATAASSSGPPPTAANVR